ncbi:MAG: serine/threonine-protein phosphatase, partial [Coriobacteriales bacterium]|nr:serine/threonine-protein phosphatase [Coriobacteriales bacterium]
MHYDFYALTNSGRCRDKNEDRIMVDGNLIKNGELVGQAKEHFIAVICDGVGGCGFGDKAASTAALSLMDACDKKQDPFTLCAELFKADDKVKIEQKKDTRCADMKTTVAALYLDEDGYLVLNAGDTRVYRLCDGAFLQLSEDHTRLKEREMDGCVPVDEGEQAILNNTITRFLGAKRDRFRPAIAGDDHCGTVSATYLLCSDGAYKGISDEQLADILELPTDLEEKARIIYRLAEGSGTHDN